MAILTAPVKVVLQRSAEKAVETGDLGLYTEELRRVKRYDEEVCPQRYRGAVKLIKETGFNNIELLRTFGERELPYSLETLAEIAKACNHISRANQNIMAKNISLSLPFGSRSFDKETLRKLLDEGIYEYSGSKITLFLLEDSIPGFKFLFGSGDRSSEIDYHGGRLYGMPEGPFWNASASRSGNPEVLELGGLKLDDLENIATMRFTYTFGIKPANLGEVADALKRLNKFPDRDEEKNYISYSLKEVEIKKLKVPKGVNLVYNEALAAQEKGLFKEVKVYELVGRVIPQGKDPVIIGLDHFGQLFPLIYWAGDPGLVEGAVR